MKVSVHQKNFKKALQLVERVTARNATLPILNNIVLKTENGRLKVIATNLEIGVTQIVGANVEEVGEIAVPGRIMSELIGGLSEETISLVTKNNNLFITASKYKTQVLGFDTKEYPIIPRVSNDSTCSISAPILRSALSSVAEAMAASDSRPELAGVYMRIGANEIALAATDSFRLAERKFQNKNSFETGVIIPRATVVESIRFLADEEAMVTLRVGDNQMAITSEDAELVSRLVDGRYPDYAKVIPEKHLTRVLVSRADLEKNIRLAGLFSSSIADIKIACSDDALTITAKNSDRGELQAEIPVLVRGDGFEMSLNFNYLLDGIKNMNTEKLAIEFTGQGSPLVLRPDDEKQKLTYLIMPLKG